VFRVILVMSSALAAATSETLGPIDSTFPLPLLSGAHQPGNASLPAVGFGTWQIPRDATERVVLEALEVGYRHFDCAFVYKNQAEIGSAFAKAFSSGTVRREDLWVTSKLGTWFHKADDVALNLRTTLNELRLDYVDLFLVRFERVSPAHPTTDPLARSAPPWECNPIPARRLHAHSASGDLGCS